METKHRKGGFLVLQREFVETAQLFDTEYVRWLLGDASWLIVALTGTQQKVDNIIDVLRVINASNPAKRQYSFCAWDVPPAGSELDGVSGGEIAAQKARDYAKGVVWPKVATSDDRYRRAFLDKRICVTSDTKMLIGSVGGGFKPVHKLRTGLSDAGYTLDLAKRTISSAAADMRDMPLVEFLPGWWASQFSSSLSHDHANSDGIIKWSTGIAAFQYTHEVGGYDGRYALAYGDSDASIMLPYTLAVDLSFWGDYMQRVLASKRDDPMGAILGMSMGIMVEEIVQMVDDNHQKYGVGIKDMNVLVPGAHNGDTLSVLYQHALGAPKDTLASVVGKVVTMNKPGECSVARRKYA